MPFKIFLYLPCWFLFIDIHLNMLGIIKNNKQSASISKESVQNPETMQLNIK